MNKTILITIQGTQWNKEYRETTEDTHRGKCRDNKHKLVISYEETYPDKSEHVTPSSKNVMTIDDTSVSLVKEGYITTEMLFQKGYTHRGLYQTPFGVFRMVIHTSDLRVDRQPDQCKLLMKYSLKLNEQFIARNHLEIRIRNEEKA